VIHQIIQTCLVTIHSKSRDNTCLLQYNTNSREFAETRRDTRVLSLNHMTPKRWLQSVRHTCIVSTSLTQKTSVHSSHALNANTKILNEQEQGLILNEQEQGLNEQEQGLILNKNKVLHYITTIS